MSLSLRGRAAALALGLAAAVSLARAEGFPARPIHLVVTGAPGASTDIIARRLGRLMEQQSGATVVVENKGGASGSIALLSTIRAPADGYTLVIAVPDSVTVYPLLKKSRPYDAERELTPIAEVAEAQFAFVVNAREPASTMAEFIARLKSRPPGQPAIYASPGSGTTGRLVTEMLLQRAGVTMLHAPYRSTVPGLQGVAGGEVDLMATSLASAKALMDSGRIKAIGLTRDKRLPSFEGVPTLAESGFPDLVVPVWWGVFAPAHLPREVRDKLVAIIVRAADSEDFRAQLAALGLEPKLRAGAEFAAFLRADTQMWAAAIRKADIPLED